MEGLLAMTAHKCLARFYFETVVHSNLCEKAIDFELTAHGKGIHIFAIHELEG